MPTLLSINNYYYRRGGAEMVFLEQNRMFEEAGWKVVPFAMQHANNFASPWSDYFVEEIEFGSEYSLFGKLRRVPKVIYSVEARNKLDRLLKAANPDVCHAHNIYHHISPSILGLLKRRGVPTVLTLHDLKIACPAYNMLAPDGICERCKGGRFHNVLFHRCIKQSIGLSAVVLMESLLHEALGTYRNCVSRFVVPSQFYIDKLAEWNMPRSLFRHVPNFVDVDTFRPSFEAGNGFLYFGRVSREKGLATLVSAAAAAGCPVQIAGTGEQLTELQEQVARLGADVTFLGYLTGTALHDAIRRARAVVLPSEWYENAPMSVLEAYALGKPVIGARIGGIPELIREGETGLTFTSGDSESLGSTLREMMERSNADVEEMGRAGHAWVKSDFSASNYHRRILGVFQDLGVTTSHAPSETSPYGRGGASA